MLTAYHSSLRSGKSYRTWQPRVSWRARAAVSTDRATSVSAASSTARRLSTLGSLARVFDQDEFNLEAVQKGLRTTRKAGVTFAVYQESKIRHFHHLLDQWLEKAPDVDP